MLRKFEFFSRMTGAALTGLTVVTLLLPLSAQAADPPTKAPAVAEAPAAPAQAGPAVAPAPHNSAATWRDARGGIAGFTTVRGTETGVLISSQGNTWRAIRNGLITPYGGALLLTVAGLILLFYKKTGPIKLHTPKTGRSMERFTLNERRAHWLVAISFVCLALSGIILLFGKHIFLWLLGHDLFSWLGWLSKNLHIAAGFVFVFGVAILFKIFWRDNLWDKSDAEWIRKGGGLATKEHVPSRRFNFGEKVWFWLGLSFFGLIMIASGLVLTFPNIFDTRAAMQYAEIVHAVSACLVIAMSLGHIYMGTVGMEGAFDAMKTGQVDEAWAKEHHEIWYQEELAKRNGGGS